MRTNCKIWATPSHRAPASVFQSLKIDNTFPEPHLVIFANINKSKVHEVVLPHEEFFLSKFFNSSGLTCSEIQEVSILDNNAVV